jgi:hypothetical protein
VLSCPFCLSQERLQLPTETFFLSRRSDGGGGGGFGRGGGPGGGPGGFGMLSIDILIRGKRPARSFALLLSNHPSSGVRRKVGMSPPRAV